MQLDMYTESTIVAYTGNLFWELRMTLETMIRLPLDIVSRTA